MITFKLLFLKISCKSNLLSIYIIYIYIYIGVKICTSPVAQEFCKNKGIAHVNVLASRIGSSTTIQCMYKYLLQNLYIILILFLLQFINYPELQLRFGYCWFGGRLFDLSLADSLCLVDLSSFFSPSLIPPNQSLFCRNIGVIKLVRIRKSLKKLYKDSSPS